MNAPPPLLKRMNSVLRFFDVDELLRGIALDVSRLEREIIGKDMDQVEQVRFLLRVHTCVKEHFQSAYLSAGIELPEPEFKLVRLEKGVHVLKPANAVAVYFLAIKSLVEQYECVDE